MSRRRSKSERVLHTCASLAVSSLTCVSRSFVIDTGSDMPSDVPSLAPSIVPSMVPTEAPIKRLRFAPPN